MQNGVTLAPGVVSRVMTGIAIAVYGLMVALPQAVQLPPVLIGLYLVVLGIVWAIGR